MSKELAARVTTHLPSSPITIHKYVYIALSLVPNDDGQASNRR